MSSTKYTLDRIEDGYAIFLKYPDEEEHVIIAMSAIDKEVREGDYVMIEEIDGTFYIEILKEETVDKKAEMQSLMERLRNKK
ncbi:MAG: DUF3006 domain-containing protein [Lysinibacillus sp.]